MRRRGSGAFTLVEGIVAAVLGLLVLVMLHSLLSTAGRSEARLGGKASAVANAQLALEEVVADLQSMTPPDPYQPQTTIRVREDGRAIAFFRTQVEGPRMVAVPVTFEARPTKKGCGNFGLYKNGRVVAGIVLRDLKFEIVANASGNPVAHLVAIGIGEDLPESKTPAGDLHLLETDVPLTAVSPVAIVGLPQAAVTVAQRALSYKGSLPAL